VAFVPVDRGLYNEVPVPPDWKADIERRVFYDHDSVTGVDVSLRNFILTMSQGPSRYYRRGSRHDHL